MSQSSAKSLTYLTSSLANASMYNRIVAASSSKQLTLRPPKATTSTTGYVVAQRTRNVHTSATAAHAAVTSRGVNKPSSSSASNGCFDQPASTSSSGTGTSNRAFHSSAYSNHQTVVNWDHVEPPPIPRKGSPPSSEGSHLHPHASSSGGGPPLAVTSEHPSTSSLNSTVSNQKETNFDRGAFFSAESRSSWSQNNLPSFFGASLNVSRKGNFVFRNGAYGIPKTRPEDDGEDMSAVKSAKGKEKASTSPSSGLDEPEHPLSVSVGEDAYFVRADSLGVADGVGGWSGHAGANPARWSRKLMHNCASELARYENVEDELFLRYYDLDPVDILQRAFEKSLTECREEGVIGSSTALLAVLRHDELRLANLGDCCCFIIRGSDFIFRSEEQQHSFNFPVQVGTSSKDTPVKDAQRFTIKVQKDDIVILSSDGLVDNLFDEDILEEVLRFVETAPPPQPPTGNSSSPARPGQRFTLNRFSPQLVSEALCLRAKSVYEDQRAVASPFQQKALEEGIHFAGGKRDDVTTLVGVIGELEGSPDRR